MKINLSILLKKPELDTKAILTIQPLAPLSIVSTLPGSYYKSLDKPTKANLCGMFENVMGWHIGLKDRRAIVNKMKEFYNSEFNINDFEVERSEVGYTSLISHLFNIDLPLTPPIVARYDDYWTQQLKHDDARHLKGTPNLSYQLIKKKTNLPTDKNGKVSDSTYTKFLKENNSDFPMYYTSPTPREFIILDGDYQIKLSMSLYLFDSLKSALEDNNIAYLGTNEGWVNLSIKEL